MENNALNREIKEYLSHVKIDTKEDRLNICAWMYKKVKDSTNPVYGFHYFLANIDSIDSDDSLTVEEKFTSNDLKVLKAEFGNLTDAIFEKILKENLDEDAFYSKLWTSITQNPMLDSEASKVFAIYYILIDARIPYYKLSDGMSMPNAKFAEISKQIEKDIEKARFILRTNRFEQRTNRASVMLELLDSYKDTEKRVVLMAHILSLSRKSMDMSRLLEMLGETD